MNTSDIINLFIAIGTIGTLIVAIGTMRTASKSYEEQANSNKDQANSQLFIYFTERYHKIRESLPKDKRKVFTEAFSPDNQDKERTNAFTNHPNLTEDKELENALISYLNLTSEELYMYKNDLLQKKLWSYWEEDLRIIVQQHWFVDKWESDLRQHFNHPDFTKLIDHFIANWNFKRGAI